MPTAPFVPLSDTNITRYKLYHPETLASYTCKYLATNVLKIKSLKKPENREKDMIIS